MAPIARPFTKASLLWPSNAFGLEGSMTENIDNVLEQLVLAGGEKIDWSQPDPDGQQGRFCPIGSWSIKEDTDCSVFEHLDDTITKRLCRLDLNVSGDAHLQAIYDPETRRIEALEVYECTTGGVLLTLWFWPGLDAACRLAIGTLEEWRKAIENGWFEGI